MEWHPLRTEKGSARSQAHADAVSSMRSCGETARLKGGSGPSGSATIACPALPDRPRHILQLTQPDQDRFDIGLLRNRRRCVRLGLIVGFVVHRS